MSPGWGRRFFKRWIKWIDRSGLEPMKRVGQLLSRHLENILTFCHHWITNGVAEGLDSKIMSIKRRACGYSNKDHLKTAIYVFAVESICTRGQFGHVTHRVSGRTKNVEPPCLSGKGTITIKKHYVDEYNEKYSNNQIKIESLLDVAFENRKIILSKK